MNSVCNELLFISPWKQNFCVSIASLYRVSIKSFPHYRHLLQENYVEYKHISFFQNLTQLKNFDIWLAVHHSITFLLLPIWYTNFLFIHTNYIKLNSSTCFKCNPPIIRRSTTQIVHMQTLVLSLSANDRFVQPLRLHKTVAWREWRYQSLHMNNLRRWPPDDGRIALETCRGILI
jgi:hypothetical protein